MTAILITIHALLCVLIVFLVLLHSGRDTGLSGAFGVGSSSGAYGGSTAIVERNLDRITVAVSILFFLTTYLLSRQLN